MKRIHIIIPIVLSMLMLSLACNKEEVSTKTNSQFKVVVDNNPTDGEILIAPYTIGNTTGKLYVLDEHGNVIKEKQTDGIAMNFERWVVDGKTRYSYLVEDKNGYHIPGYSAYIPGYYVITDEDFNEITRLHLLPYGNITTDVQDLLDAHDLIMISDDHFLTMTYYEKYVQNIPDSLNPASSVRVVAPIIQEIQSGQVVWQWDGTDHPELYANSVEGNNYQNITDIQDYAHMNSMFVDQKDNNVICSFRNLDQVIKINRQNGEIIWTLGGKNSSFQLSENEKFLRQHNATYNDNKLLLFDNGEISTRMSSRVVEFQLDETNKTILNFSSYNLPVAFTQYMGSVRKSTTENIYIICGGSAKYLLEVNYLTGKQIFLMELGENSYRATKYYR